METLRCNSSMLKLLCLMLQNCLIKLVQQISRAHHCCLSLPLRCLSLLLKHTSHDSCTGMRRWCALLLFASHSGFRTLTPPDPEAHASCLTKSMIAPGSPYIRQRICDPNTSATRLGFTPQLQRLAYSRCKALAQTMSDLQRAQPPWCCA